ncbi:hypothetical protein PG984_006239 [Apiospora sp. TS-2023a]
MRTASSDLVKPESPQGPGAQLAITETPRPTVESFTVCEKKTPILLAEPIQFPINIVTGEHTTDVTVGATFDLNSHDDWIRRDMAKELKLEVEPMKTEETNIGPEGNSLIPQGQVSLTWSSYSPDSKSTSTFLVHTDLSSRVVFGSGLISETMASSSPAAFAFWRSKLTDAQTEELREQHRQRNVSLTMEQQAENRRRREEKARAHHEMNSATTSRGGSTLTVPGNEQPPTFSRDSPGRSAFVSSRSESPGLLNDDTNLGEVNTAKSSVQEEAQSAIKLTTANI